MNRLLTALLLATAILSPRIACAADTAPLPPIKTVTTKAGMVYVNGKPFIGDGWNASSLDTIASSPGSIVRWPYGGFYRDAEDSAAGKTVDLEKTEPVIDALEKSGKYAVIIFEPYWGQPEEKWDQVDWQGKHRGAYGLDTNACWRNTRFIDDRLKRVRETIDFIKKTPRLHDRVLGYIVWNENRWAMGEETCYCNYCQAAWPEWLKSQYTTVDALNAAYHTRYKGFVDVPLPHPTIEGLTPMVGMESMGQTERGPVRHVTDESAWRDFHLFKADGLAQFENLGSAAAKQADPSRLTITSLFTRGIAPSIGHVLTRLYREMGESKTIDIIGGNQYEVFPLNREPRNIELWRGTPDAHAKPVWFTEFNDIGSPYETPYDTRTLNALLARTTFSGESGRIWFTDRDKSRLGVLEQDGSQGERYRAILAASQFQSAHIDNVVQAARNDLPRQVGVVNLDQWQALADNGYYNMSSLSALAAFSEWGGFAARYVSEPDIANKSLQRYKALVLWQAQRAADIGGDAAERLKEYVQNGGTLICDAPLLQDANGVGPRGDLAKFTGVTFSREQRRDRIEIDDKAFGRFALASTAPDKDSRGSYNLGQWVVDIDGAAAAVVHDTTGQPAVVTHRYGKGSVVTLCFRLCATENSAPMQAERGKFLTRIVQGTGLAPLVDAPALQKTIAPQDNGGLIVTLFNAGTEPVESPLSFPGRANAKIDVIRMPIGGALSAGTMKLPPGEWAVVTVK